MKHEYQTYVWLSSETQNPRPPLVARRSSVVSSAQRFPAVPLTRDSMGGILRRKGGSLWQAKTKCERLKRQVQAEMDRLTPDLLAVSRFLHANPELAYEEHQAAELLADVLEQHGFAVTRGVADLPTAFTGRGRDRAAPRIAFLAEYDALPGLGHACGHNLIGTASLGAALGGAVRPGSRGRGRSSWSGARPKRTGAGRSPWSRPGSSPERMPPCWSIPATGRRW